MKTHKETHRLRVKAPRLLPGDFIVSANRTLIDAPVSTGVVTLILSPPPENGRNQTLSSDTTVEILRTVEVVEDTGTLA